LKKYEGSLEQMLRESLPGIRFDEDGGRWCLQLYLTCALTLPFSNAIDKQEEAKKKEIRKAGYWEDREHRREFLLDFAKNMGFDPAIASNWKGTKFKIQASQVKYRL